MKKMNKICLIAVMAFLFAGCRKSDTIASLPQTPSDLAIASTIGVKLQTVFVTNEVSMNVKSNVPQTVTIKILNIANYVVSKSTADVQSGDNILKLYTAAFPSSAYRIAIYDSKGNMLAITDFNKL
jgi:PBP1b-binding outer membrane lipoprotein LpoB